eukprot:1150295-Pelagomonas_calceolata.AAC.1
MTTSSSCKPVKRVTASRFKRRLRPMHFHQPPHSMRGRVREAACARRQLWQPRPHNREHRPFETAGQCIQHTAQLRVTVEAMHFHQPLHSMRGRVREAMCKRQQTWQPWPHNREHREPFETAGQSVQR